MRGGKREGAGAPKGNLNRLKHGKRSKQLEQALETLLADPETRNAVIDVVKATRRGVETKETVKKVLKKLEKHQDVILMIGLPLLTRLAL